VDIDDDELVVVRQVHSVTGADLSGDLRDELASLERAVVPDRHVDRKLKPQSELVITLSLCRGLHGASPIDVTTHSDCDDKGVPNTHLFAFATLWHVPKVRRQHLLSHLPDALLVGLSEQRDGRQPADEPRRPATLLHQPLAQRHDQLDRVDRRGGLEKRD
jgi:hypothetical protein